MASTSDCDSGHHPVELVHRRIHRRGNHPEASFRDPKEERGTRRIDFPASANTTISYFEFYVCLEAKNLHGFPESRTERTLEV